MTMMRSATWAIRPMSCPIMTRPQPISSCTLHKVFMTWRWVTTSSALVGSSAMMSRGFSAMAMAMQARCFIPPESSMREQIGDADRQADAGQDVLDKGRLLAC